MIYLLIILGIAAGVFTKFTDLIIDDGIKTKKYMDYIFGLIYGIVIAYAIITFPVISEIYIAPLIAVLLSGKIDAPAHYIGFAATFSILFLVGISPLNLGLFGIFVFASILDEIVSDKKLRNKNIKKFISLRPFLEITAFLVFMVTGEILIWLAILSYDIGYIITNEIGLKYLK